MRAMLHTKLEHILSLSFESAPVHYQARKILLEKRKREIALLY